MKKIFATLLIMTFVVFGTAYAKEKGTEHKVMGKVTAVDKNNKVVTVTDVNGKEFKIAVLPNTELEFKFRKSVAVFDNLSEGQWVEADYIIGSPLNSAKEIEIHDK